MPNIIRSYKTKGIKELQTFIEPGTAHYRLQWDQGGELPTSLSGLFTSLNTVDQVVLTYLSNHKEEIRINEAEKAKAKYESKQVKNSEEE